MKSLIAILAILLSIQLYSQEILVFFDKDDHTLTSESIQTLDELTIRLKSTSNRNDIALIGHTDTDASEKYNEQLALRRAHSVREYLLSQGIYNRFHLVSKGENENLTEEINEDDKHRNRRVSIELNYETSEPMAPLFPQQEQVFKIPPNEERTIVTAGGTTITFGKDIFDNVAWHRMIEIRVREYYDKGAFILADLNTVTADNRALESKGMIDIQAIQLEDTLALKAGKSIDIQFPVRNVNDDMELFSGVKQNGGVVWDQTTFNSSRLFSSGGWSKSWFGTHDHVIDSISSSQWWYEDIDNETYKITETIDYQNNKKVIYDTADVANELLMEAFTQSTPNMGWINCDRFWKESGPKTDLIVEYKGDQVPIISIVFEDINSILPYSYRENNKYIFANVPVGRKIKVIGLHAEKGSEDILFGSKDCSITARKTQTISLAPLSKEEVASRMAQL